MGSPVAGDRDDDLRIHVEFLTARADTSLHQVHTRIVQYEAHRAALVAHAEVTGVQFDEAERISLYGVYKRATLELEEVRALASGGTPL